MIRYSFDHHVPAAIAVQFERRGLDVLKASTDGMSTASDEELLDRATHLGRVLDTHDKDFLRIAAERQREGRPFSGIIYGPQDENAFGRYVVDLEMIAKISGVQELANIVTYIPL